MIEDPAPESDISPVMHDPGTQAPWDLEARQRLERYFADSPGSFTEKLENFAKYVPRQSLARLLARYEMFSQVKDIQGSIVECGVLFGGGLMAFAKLSAILEPYNFQRRVIGFDTFSGFPSVSDRDISGRAERRSTHLRVGGFPAGDAVQDLVEAIAIFDASRFLNHFPKVELHPGDFLETGPKFLTDNPHLVVSLLYLDFDLYDPTRLALELFLPRMPKGSVIAFDELNEEGFPGETLAVVEALGLPNLRLKRFDFEPRISYAVIGE